MEDKELTIADILDVNAKVKLVRQPIGKKGNCERCILYSLCGESKVLKNPLCFQDAGEGHAWVFDFETSEESV